ncbi:cache domain-containing protein [Cohnella hashimotonis]|uniref:Cache domain-containing protein n=1 Tax=Cohnella hashimotonis TaxID=2826895 RepID=A0ABT6TTH7_9BACL|nr:cache domain-containing protein [Cohnella hashimotonis]MDI4649239.1 cache domain-containing protein [Cohnella hashimotonis]
MFRKLNVRIVFLVCLSLWLTSLTIGAFAYLYARNTMSQQFHSVFDSYFKSSADNLTHDLNYTVEMLRMIGANSQVRKALDSPDYDSTLPHQLDALILNSTLRIQGMTLYTSRGLVYATSLTSNPPALAQLAALPRLAVWMADAGDDPLWTWRSPDEVRDFYNGKYGSDGVLTLAIKLSSTASRQAGYAVIDFNPDYLFQFFQTKNASLKGVGVGIADERGQWLASNRSSPAEGVRAAFAVRHPIQNAGAVLVAVVPEAAVREPLHALRTFLAVSSSVFLIISLAVSLYLRHLIVAPLSRLYLKMKKFKNRPVQGR